MYSNFPLSLTYRKENFELISYKRKMVEDIFLQYHQELSKCTATHRVYSRFIWDGFRGIMAVKNEEKARLKLKLLIKE